MWHVPTLQRTHALLPNWVIKIHYNPFHDDTFNSYIYDDMIPTTASFNILWILVNIYITSQTLLIIGHLQGNIQYGNAAVVALQFWTADLEAHVLSSAIEQVYNAFFYTTSMHLLHQQYEEVLFSCFMTTLNASFESKLALEDEGYKSGSENFNIPTPLRHTPRIYHVSSDDNISFDPSTPCSTATSQSHHKPV